MERDLILFKSNGEDVCGQTSKIITSMSNGLREASLKSSPVEAATVF